MKVLKITNQKGIERYYSEFNCSPVIVGDDVSYAVDAMYYDCENHTVMCDCLKVSSDMVVAMSYCVELSKQLEKQLDCSSDDPLFIAYFEQCKNQIGG